jgi:C4-dicarboxylate transporter DctQ subunit
MSFLMKANRLLLKLSGLLVMLAMAAIAVVIPYEVFCRYVLGTMNTWSAEFCMYSFVWATLLGGAAGLRKGYHVGITTLMDALPPPAAKNVQTVIHLLMAVFLAVMAWYGAVQAVANLRQTSSSMGISMTIPYAALPVGFFIMFTNTLEQLLESLGFGGGRDR